MNKYLEGAETLGAIVDGIRLVRYPDGKVYKVTNDNTHFSESTPDDIIKILESLRTSKRRVRFHWGDMKTGKDWGDTYDVCGTVGRTTCRHSPILVNNARSMGGTSILTDSIVKITETRAPYSVIYEHPTYHK